MTDRVDTYQDLASTIMQISESLNATEPPTMERIVDQLVPLLDAAEKRGDNEGVALIVATHARAQELLLDVKQSREVARTAIEIATTAHNQRVTAINELEELTDDLDNINLSNAQVRYVHNEGKYDTDRTDEVEFFHAERLYNRQLDTVTRLCNCDREKARKFLDALWTEEYAQVDVETVELFETIGNIINFAESY